MTRSYGNRKRTRAAKNNDAFMRDVFTGQSEAEIKALVAMGLTETQAREMVEGVSHEG